MWDRWKYLYIDARNSELPDEGTKKCWEKYSRLNGNQRNYGQI